MNRHLTSGLCITNNPHPSPPQGEGALFRDGLTVELGRGMDPDWSALLGRGCRG